jgi:ion channel-forming bestrophin family protein
MFVDKNFGFKGIMMFTGGHVIWLSVYAALVTCLFEYTHWEWMTISWLPISLIGTAVAFYIGFKNNQAYDRLWEARKIWGGIVNSSRAWGSNTRAYITNHFSDNPVSKSELDQHKKEFIYRHIAWLYTLRSQLLQHTPWEHINQHPIIAKTTKKRMKMFGVGLVDDHNTEELLRELMPTENCDKLFNAQNTATHILDRQSQELVVQRENGLIDDFRHMELQNMLNGLYALQGKCERIKKFPLPRQYGGMSFIFVGIFIALLPFGMASEFQKFGELGVWLAIPFTIIVGWVYLVMELVGDYSENPFEGLANDIPMLSICRTIEIDLREMLRETDIPPQIEARNGVLM